MSKMIIAEVISLRTSASTSLRAEKDFYEASHVLSVAMWAFGCCTSTYVVYDWMTEIQLQL